MFCEKCFVLVEKEPHKPWCPEKKDEVDVPEALKDLFGMK